MSYIGSGFANILLLTKRIDCCLTSNSNRFGGRDVISDVSSADAGAALDMMTIVVYYYRAESTGLFASRER